MNQKKTLELSLRDYTRTDSPFGNIQGKEVFAKLLQEIEKFPEINVFVISLENIKATDASFPRESIVSIAKHFRGVKGICLKHLDNQDLIDNWQYAAEAKEQPLIIWHHNNRFELLGPRPTTSTYKLIEHVLTHTETTATQAATALELSIQNTSTQLKKLVNQGYILRSEDVAESGGIEFIYHAIK